MNFKNKKGQVTVFVIIGIIILASFGIFYAVRRSSSQLTEQEVATKIAETPVEFQPINDFVMSCIQKIGKEGIKKIGFHGGYTDLNKYGIQTKPSEPTEGRAFLFNPQDVNSGVAYWHYFKSNNQCQTGCVCGTEKPYLYRTEGDPNFEKQLDDYIDENLDSCLDEFKAFKSQGFDTKAIGNVETKTTIRDQDVMFYVNYKINSKRDGSEFEIDQFITTVPVNLEKIYDMASELVNEQINYTYLEKWTVEQIAGFGLGLDKNKLPPMAASELSPGEQPVYWVKQKVEQDIQNNMLPLYTPFFTVYGTKNYNYDTIGTFYERATLPIQNPDQNDYNTLDVDFNYLNWWPVYFDITGRGVSGQRIGPETASSSFFSFIGIKRYNFYYDLSYPVLVDIYDGEAFNGEGMHFYIGLESNVRNNQALNCSGAGLNEYALPSGSMMCNYDQGCADVTIKTVDAKTQKPLENVIIYYSSGSESCDKGFTEIQGNDAVIEASLPQCVGSGCSINAVKEGYWYYPQTYAVRCGRAGSCGESNVLCNNENLRLELEPLRNNSVVVMKKKMLKQSRGVWNFNDVAERLLDNEYAVISLEKIKENPNEDDFSLIGTFYGNQSSMNFYPGLIPGNYEMRVDLFYQFPDNQGRDYVTFKAVEECEDGFLGMGDECYTLGPYNFTDVFVEGGFESNITISRDMLDNHETLIFYALSIPDVATSYDILDVYDLEEIGQAQNYSQQYKVQLKPDAR